MSERTLSEEAPIFKAVGGEVLYRGVWLPEDTATELWNIWDRIANAPDDYARAYSAGLRDQLGEVMAEAYGQ